MGKIVRTPTEAKGGITEAEKSAMDVIAQKWIGIAMGTGRADLAAVERSITALYAAADLKKPRIVLVPSPYVMALAGGAASWIWHLRKQGKNPAVLAAATNSAVNDRTRAAETATYAATLVSTDDVTRATDAASESYHAAENAASAAADAAIDAATDDAFAFLPEELRVGALQCAKRWRSAYQGGNMWAWFAAYAEAARDVLGLTGLSCWGKYQSWEDAAKAGGFRWMHEEFCLVSDFPEVLRVDERNLPHCENGPSHRWRDGWEFYSWHGEQVPKEWIVGEGPTIHDALHHENTEKRRAACEIIGWERVLDELNGRTIHDSGDGGIGAVVEVDIPEIGRERFLRVDCGTGRKFALPIPPDIDTAMAAQSWIHGGEYVVPEIRT